MTNPSPRIHIIDDDASFRAAIGELLSACGYRVALYASAKELLEASPRSEPACILLDVQMAGLSGPQLQDRLAELGYRLPIVYITGHGDIKGTLKTYQNLPKNLQIIMTGHESLHLQSDTNIYASIYAPKAKVTLDHKGDLYGAVLAKSLKIGNQSLVHYDESLRGTGGSMVCTVK